MATAGGRAKTELIDTLVGEFRMSGNLDNAFDAMAAEHLGVNRTDLHCLNVIENSGGLTAGELATEIGLSTGAVTGVIDRLERAGYARRVPDTGDRRRIKVEVTPSFYTNAERIWGPVKADWESTLGERFTVEQLERAIDFLRVTNEIARRHMERLGQMR
jgi:DNA-binding MarR family transcriptional regulator